MREPSRGQVSRKKYPAFPASQLVLDILLGKGKFFYISCYPTAPASELEDCLLTISSLYPPVYTHTQKHKHPNFLFAFGTWIAEGFCSKTYRDLCSQSDCLFRTLTPPSFFCYVCQWKKLANPIYKYFCLLALCLMLYY